MITETDIKPRKRWEYIQKDGSMATEQNADTVAKKFLNFEDNTVRYYVLLSGGSVFDPMNTGWTYLKRRQWKFRLVDETTYTLYLRYLGVPNKKTRGQTTFRLHAERRI